MDGSIDLSADDRKVLLRLYRTAAGAVRRRAHVLLLAAAAEEVLDCLEAWLSARESGRADAQRACKSLLVEALTRLSEGGD